MKVEELVGRLAVRVRTVTVRSGYTMLSSGPEEDASFTNYPVFIEAVEHGVGYYRMRPDDEVRIIGARYLDEHWAPVNERFYPKEWREHFNPTPTPEAP